jgi:dTDP-4-amino-4,6-dideoxygalactose transaminase
MISIPMSSPDITSAEVDAVNAVLRTPYLSIGPRVDEFERRVAPFGPDLRQQICVKVSPVGCLLFPMYNKSTDI